MGADGSCPSCGRIVATAERSPERAARRAEEEQPFEPPEGEEVPTKIPWHFWILVVAVVLYLGWRTVQMIGWLLD